jgi:plasmid replication initiation protein
MAKMLVKKNRGKILLIKKSNDLIESRYKFDVWETRFFLSVLSLIRREDVDLKVYRIHYRDIINIFGLRGGQSYAYLREAADSLMGKRFYVPYVAADGIKREMQYHVIRSVDYMKQGQEGHKAASSHEYIDVTIDPEMKPLLLELQKNFTAYDLQNVVKLGAYPIRVYELIKQYESIGHRTLAITDIKHMLELDKEYPQFANFYARIIEPARKEINEFTDLSITEIEKIKQGRKVTGLKFSFRAKDKKELEQARGLPIQKTLFEQGLAFTLEDRSEDPEAERADRLFMEFEHRVVKLWGVSPVAFASLLRDTQEEQLRQAVAVTERAVRAHRANNPAGFFIDALKNGYQDTVVSKELHEKEIQLAKVEYEELATAYMAARNNFIRKIVERDEHARIRAIEKVKGLPQYQKRLKHIGADPEDVATYRTDPELREAVSLFIIAENEIEFQAIAIEYGPRLEELGKFIGLKK